jgi:hypothetical protein
VNDDIEQGEVLWITPDICYLPELPDGYALRVDGFCGWDYDSPGQRRVWLRGRVLLNAHGVTLCNLVLCVPVDQPRAVCAPSELPRAAGTARLVDGVRRDNERVWVERPGRPYRRGESPGR